jgi:hypothetical protein
LISLEIENGRLILHTNINKRSLGLRRILMNATKGTAVVSSYVFD